MTKGGEGAQPDDPRADDHHQIALAWRLAHEPVHRDGDGLVQARGCVGHRVGKRVEHRRVAHHLLGPATAEA